MTILGVKEFIQFPLQQSNNIKVVLTSSLLPKAWDKRVFSVTVPNSVRQTNISPRGRQLNCERAGSNASVTINTDTIRQVRTEVRRSSLPNRDITACRTPS
jgi:hypothetical protein